MGWIKSIRCEGIRNSAEEGNVEQRISESANPFSWLPTTVVKLCSHGGHKVVGQ